MFTNSDMFTDGSLDEQEFNIAFQMIRRRIVDFEYDNYNQIQL